MSAVYYSRAPSRQCGWITKLSHGGIRKSWNRRWMTLTDGELRCYKTEENRHVHCFIDLHLYFSVAHDPSCKKSPFAFIIEPHKDTESAITKPHLFYADSLEEMQSWIRAIEPYLGQRSVLDKWLGLYQKFIAKNHHQKAQAQRSSEIVDAGILDHSRSLNRSRSSSSNSSVSSWSTTGTSVGFTDSHHLTSRSDPTLNIVRTVSLPAQLRGSRAAVSLPTSPVSRSFTARRNIIISPLINLNEEHLPPPSVPTAATEDLERFVQSPLSPPPYKKKENSDKAERRRSSSMPRFDSTKSTIVTPTFGSFAV